MGLVIGVVGLGLFGRRVALTLAELGVEVIAVDLDAAVIEDMKDRVAHAACLDVTDEAALRESGLLSADRVIVAIGENQGASILVTALLRKMGVPHIIGRSHSPLHAQVLLTVGAERTLDPEEEMGIRLAQELYAPDVYARMRLTTGQEVVEVQAHRSLVGKTLQELNFRQKYALNVVAIKQPLPGTAPGDRRPEAWKANALPRPDDVVREGDVLVVIGEAERVREFLDL